MIKKIVFIISFLVSLVSLADETNFTMSAPQIVSVGEQFSLSLSLNAKGEDLRMPELTGFDLLMGPSVSSSTSFQFINGKSERSINYSYTYILRAGKEGTYTISPATIKSGRKVYQSNQVNIKVIQGRQTTPAPQQGGNSTPATGSSEAGSSDNLFIRIETNKTNVYKGEMITATLKLFTRGGGLSIVDQTMPSFEGFWTQDIELPPADQTRTREAVDGVIYNVYTLQKKILIPQQTGNLAIAPADMVLDVQQKVRSQSVFDDFFGSYQNVRTTISTKRVPINVKPLPTAPAGYNGAVGKFTISSSIDKDNITANEAITIKVRIEGNGNLKHITPFEFSFPPDFEVYDPKTSYNYKASDAGIIGSTSFEQVIIPRFAGDFTIPPQKFIYFDSASKSYQTLYTKQFDIHVEKGTVDQSTTVVSSLSKENVKYIGKDIRYIKQTNLRLSAINDFFFGSIPFYSAYIIALLIFITIVLLQKKRARESADAALMRNKKASKMARKHLNAASLCVKTDNKEEFFDALIRAFWGYLSDKLTLPLSELNRENAKATLTRFQVDDTTIDEFIAIIDTCEMARFAPSAVHESITELYKQAEKLIGKFEKQIRKKA